MVLTAATSHEEPIKEVRTKKRWAALDKSDIILQSRYCDALYGHLRYTVLVYGYGGWLLFFSCRIVSGLWAGIPIGVCFSGIKCHLYVSSSRLATLHRYLSCMGFTPHYMWRSCQKQTYYHLSISCVVVLRVFRCCTYQSGFISSMNFVSEWFYSRIACYKWRLLGRKWRNRFAGGRTPSAHQGTFGGTWRILDRWAIFPSSCIETDTRSLLLLGLLVIGSEW